MNKKRAGVTLIEIIIVLVVLGIVSSIIGPLLLKAATSANIAYKINQIDSQGRFALARVSEDIRNTETLANDSTATQINLTTVDSDSISYALSGSNYLTREDNNVTGDLAANISALSFTYYDENGAQIPSITAANVATVAYVRPSFTITDNGQSENYRTTVFLRNATITPP